MTWRAYVDGQKVKCPSCEKYFLDVGPETLLRIRIVVGRLPGAGDLPSMFHQCHRCKSMLEIQMTWREAA